MDSHVLITSIGKTGRVEEAARGGRYRVRVGGVLMVCREEELRDAASEKRQRSARGSSAAQTAGLKARATLEPASKSQRARLGSIDLHGFTVEEAVRQVEERLDRALREGLDHLEIIHGRGSGRIKIAVHRLLGELTVVRRFEVSADNPGVTNVYL